MSQSPHIRTGFFHAKPVGAVCSIPLHSHGFLRPGFKPGTFSLAQSPYIRTGFFLEYLRSYSTPVHSYGILQQLNLIRYGVGRSTPVHLHGCLQQRCTSLTRAFIHFSENPYVCLVDGYSRLLVNRRFHRPTSARNLQSFMSDSLSHHGG